ncbi:MAG TPA: phosphate regulon sensor histidine kinase PhoR [Burkholderiales bacterium]|nr:phosphate regulon sensor histidine kinase PhoR [Burkholderiales bacterium]
MRSVWNRSLAALGIILAISILSGLLLGLMAALIILVIVTLFLVLYHTRQLDHLQRWSVSETETPVPLGSWVWEQVFANLHRRVRAHKEAEENLTTTLTQMREAAEAMPDGMVILTGDDRIEWFNWHATSYLGLNPEHDIGNPLANLVRQPEISEFVAHGNFGEPLVVKPARDPRHTLALQIIPYGAKQKLLVARDISELEEVETMRRDFIANVSHELRTPLTVLCGFLETLESLPPDDPEAPRYLKLMKTQADSMQRLVNDLLTLSQLESPQNPLKEAPIDIAALARSTYENALGLSAGSQQINLQIDSATKILGSETELASAFGNLASNAVRYTPRGGNITLSWHNTGDQAVFEVSDTGIGIAPEHIPRITERFYRVDRGRSRDTGGTGLGLAIVKHVVLRHQAELSINSTLGKGSSFAIRFPATRCLA